MKNKFYAATNKELENVSIFKRMKAKFHITFLLPHKGEIRIDDNGIDLGGWRYIKLSEINEIQIKNDNALSSVNFATQRRLFMNQSAKPIQIKLTNGEIIYLYVDWSIGTGLSANKKVLADIEERMTA